MSTGAHAALDAWIESHFAEQVRFLQQLIQVPTDTPPGNNAAHAQRTAQLLRGFGLAVEEHPVPVAQVQAAGMQSVTNLVLRRRYAGLPGQRIIGLNAHGDVVAPGDGWQHDPYGGAVVDGKLYGRAAAVSKCDFATYTFATRALESLGLPLKGGIDLYFTYDEELGGALGPGWLLRQGLVQADLIIAAGFSYQVVTAHNGCLQLQVTVTGRMGHAAVPSTGVDALFAATHILHALYAQNALFRTQPPSQVPGINCPYLPVGRIEGGTHTNVIPGQVLLQLDRRMIPEEDPVQVEAQLRQLIHAAVAELPGISLNIQRLLLAHALRPLSGNQPLVLALCRHASTVFGEPISACGSPLYADARLFAEAGIPAVLYGAGPPTLLQSNAKRADEHIVLEDLQRATRVVAYTLLELLS